MTTFTELQAQMTGPGGPFETCTEVIDTGLGEVEMTMYAQRFGDLRQVAQFAALAHGDKEFIVYGDRRITFAEFFAQANTISAALLAAGVVKGDRVAVLSQNNPEWCLTFWATVNIGAVLVGLNGWWTTDEILYGLEDSGAKVLVVDSKRFTRITTEINNIDTLERVYLVDVDPGESGSTSAKVPRSPSCPRRRTARLPTPPSSWTRATTPSSSTPRAPPAARRAPSAPIAR